MTRLFLLCASLLLASLPVHADELVVIPTRKGVTDSYWWMPRESAKMNLVLLSGGAGGIGMRDGMPQSNNFLIRSRDHFATGNTLAKFNVALLGNASDMRQLDPSSRASMQHVADIVAVVAHIRARSSLPIWLVGTSQGTISAAAAVIELGKKIDGVVFSASYTATQNPTSVQLQAIDKIAVPVLVISHEQDTCRVTLPRDSKYIFDKLTSSPVKKMILVSGGSNPTGNDCQALHWHGFIGMEARAANTITDWILNPQP